MYHTIMTVRGQVSDEETDGDKSLVLASAITDFEACCAEFFSLVWRDVVEVTAPLLM